MQAHVTPHVFACEFCIEAENPSKSTKFPAFFEIFEFFREIFKNFCRKIWK